MKVCPRCDQTFDDESLNFCLTDGTPLATGESQPTVVMPESGPVTVTAAAGPVRKKKKTGLWIGLGLLLLLIGVIGLAGLLYFAYSIGSQRAMVNRQVNANVMTTPKSAATPKPVATPTPISSPSVESTPAGGETKPTPKDENVDADGDSDEVVPIAWGTSAGTFKTDVGHTYKFDCPAGGIESLVWGSDVYAADSSICTAAVHAGVIKLNRGGTVTVEMRPGRAMYGSTTRNGISSIPYGEFPHSFVVR